MQPASIARPACRALPFGHSCDGTQVTLYRLSNDHGIEIDLMSYGATLVAARVPGRDGHIADVVLGYDALDDYVQGHHYFGSIVGRYANRIAGGRFVLDGHEHRLTRNDDPHHLHGGARGFDKLVWSGRCAETCEGPQAVFSCSSADGDQGYPGRLESEVRYTLRDTNELRIDYLATSNRSTIVNLTNHAYFNLRGAGNIHDQLLSVASAEFLPTDERHIPLPVRRSVAGTPMDLRRRTSLKVILETGDEQLRIAGGYDHTWVLDARSAGASVAVLHDPDSGRTLSVCTTEPGLQVYSGNFLNGTVAGKGSALYHKHAGICLEAHHFPDSPNRPDFPSVVLRPGEEYRQTTVYRFGIE